MGKKKSQPWGVALTCLLLAVAGIVTVIAGGASMTAVQSTTEVGVPAPETITDPTGLMAYMPIPTMLAGISLALVVVGILFFAFAYLMWQHNELGWYGALAFVGISLFLNVVQILFYGLAVATPMLVALAISAVILLALFHKSTIKAINPDIDYNGWKLPS